MAMFMLDHRHLPEECGIAFAAWRGFESPLRHDVALSSCASEGAGRDPHRIWWAVEARDAHAALAMLPPYVAQRTAARPMSEVPIP